VQCLVQPQCIADAHQRDARGTAEIREHLSHELMQFGVVDHRQNLPAQDRYDLMFSPLSAASLRRAFDLDGRPGDTRQSRSPEKP